MDVDTQLNFEIRLPDNLSPSARLFITGNHHALGDWDPGLIEVPRVGNRARWSVSLPADYVLQFKFTLGDWGHVEAAVDGSEIENRVLPVPRGKTTLRVAVSGFKSPGSPVEQWPSTIVGDVRVHKGFAGRNLAPRNLWVYLPPGYDQESTRRYPVIYMQDGNNCFDAATSFNGQEWKVDEAFEEGIASGKLPAAIVVGIANTAARVDEYTMVKALRGDRRTRIGGKADLYASFLIDEVKPFIDSTYRTFVDASHTAVIGSSHGGLVSLYLGIRHPGVFGAVGAVSPTLSWGNHWLTNYVRRLHALPVGLRIWIDMGTAEDAVDRNGNGVSDLIDDVREMRDLLLARGYDSARVELMLDEGAVHNEAAWAKRLPQILEFICQPWR
jgi:predicted alpha/beta superfamily hydrolase